MKKIPTLVLRDENDRKYNGTCCLVRDGKLYKRYEVKWKPGNGSGEFWGLSLDGTPWHVDSAEPENFVAADHIDPNTGKQPGWVPVGDGPEDKYHREAFDKMVNPPDGTYELVGPQPQ